LNYDYRAGSKPDGVTVVEVDATANLDPAKND
jgi:hypothetical protein